jgi:GT2 family glycosyltransferase
MNMGMSLTRRCRTFAGVVFKDWARYRRALNSPDASYLALCNRNERLTAAPTGAGFKCEWQWTSELVAPKFLPGLGTSLLRRALLDHPIRRSSAPAVMEKPDITFVIGHRGTERLPHLLATLESIAGQQGSAVECIVLEQDSEPRVAGKIPAWVRYIHSPAPRGNHAYCRSAAFNAAVPHARADALILHDNDMLVPQDYAASVLRLLAQGFEVVNPKRFVFYLGEQHTQRIFHGAAALTDSPPFAIVQNLEGGGSIAITRKAYVAVGGFDEAFVGWGGEDVEFWERACTRRAWPFGTLPIVHLWHPAQEGKHNPQAETLRLYREKALIPALERAARLKGAAGRGIPDLASRDGRT